MKKRGIADRYIWLKLSGIIILMIIIVIIIFNSTKEDNSIKKDQKEITEINNPTTKSQEPKAFTREHWESLPIYYKIKAGTCSSLMIHRTRWAFDLIENSTNGLIRFKEIEDLDPENVLRVMDLNKKRKIPTTIYTTPLATIVFRDGAISESYVADSKGIVSFNYSTNFIKNTFELIRTERGIVLEDKLFVRDFTNSTSISLNMSKADKDIFNEGKKINIDTTTNIMVICHLESSTEEVVGYKSYWKGSSSFYQVENLSITYAQIDFYNVNKFGGKYSGGCINYPNTEIRSILYTFGFKENTQIDSIMGLYTDPCSVKEIDPWIINDLNQTYTNLQKKVLKERGII